MVLKGSEALKRQRDSSASLAITSSSNLAGAAFFQTELDLILRRLHIDTVVLIGTTTPNCVRTTCYDAIALDYKTIVIERCCSSNTEEIQRVNMEDMERIGAVILR